MKWDIGLDCENVIYRYHHNLLMKDLMDELLNNISSIYETCDGYYNRTVFHSHVSYVCHVYGGGDLDGLTVNPTYDSLYFDSFDLYD